MDYENEGSREYGRRRVVEVEDIDSKRRPPSNVLKLMREKKERLERCFKMPLL